MLDRIWTGVSRRTSGNRPRQSAVARMRVVRLHAERLEERVLMAGDDPVTDSALIDTLTAPTASGRTPIFAINVATKQVATAAASAAVTEPGWEQFGSKAAFDAWLIESAIAQYGHLFGQRYGGWYSLPYLDFGMGLRAFDTMLASSSTDFSNTNLHVAGVDEADLIETDGS